MIRSILKLGFADFDRFIMFMSHSDARDVVIFVPMTTQTYKPITLPLVHACELTNTCLIYNVRSIIVTVD